jgi:hypothetical protein
MPCPQGLLGEGARRSAMARAARSGARSPYRGSPPSDAKARDYGSARGHGDLGAPIPELSWEDVEQVRRRFDALNPYDPGLVDSILKLEEENFDGDRRQQLWCYAISAKRYALFTRR